jgi:hypothetical protein
LQSLKRLKKKIGPIFFKSPRGKNPHKSPC